MVSVQSTESKDNLPRFEFISPSLIVLEKQIKNREDGSIQKVRILPVSQQAGNILPSEFRTDDRSKILLEQIRGSSRFSQILSQIQGIDQKELEKFLDEKFLGRNTSYDEDRWEGLLIFFRKPDGTIDYEKLAAWIVYNLDHLKGVSIFRDSLFFDQKSLEPGVWGHLYEFIRSDTDYKIITIPLQGNLSLTIQRDEGGFFIPPNSLKIIDPNSLKDPKSLKFINPGQKTYITPKGIVLFIMGGQLYGIFVQSEKELAEIYKSLREDLKVDTIYYLYSGDYVKENEGRKEKGIRLEILSDTLDRPKILSDRERVNAVYHGNRIIQSFHALKDGRPVIVQIATMKDTKGVLYQHYRIIEANGSYNIFQGWQRLSEESFGERENGERGNLAEVKLQDGKKLRDRILYGNNLYFAPVYDFEKRDGKGKLISTYTLPYQTSEADHILDYSRSQQELVFQARNRYVEGSDVKLLYSLNMSAKVVTVDREGRMYDINGNFIGPYYDNLTYEDLHKLKIQDVRGGFYRPPRNGDRIIAISKDGQKKEIKLYPETVGFELQTYNPDPITIDINGTVLSGEYVKIAELKPRENSKLGSLTILVFIPNYASGSESKQSLILKQNEDFIYRDGEIYLTKDGLKKIRDYLSKIGSDNVVLSVEVRSVVSHQNNKEVPGSILITQTQNLTLNFKTLEASIRQQGQEIVGIKREGNQYSFTTDPTVLTISPGPNTVIESYKDIQVGYYESGKWVPLERGYEIRQKDGNIEVVLTDPSLIALYQRLEIIGEVIYRNKDGKDRKTERIDHTFSVGVLGFELQTYNPNPITRDINGTILSDEYVAIAELKPYRNNELRPSRILVYASDPSESKILSLEQGKDFIYKDGKMSLTKKGLEKISREIGSDTVFLSVRVESVVRDRQNQRVPESSITEEGRLTLNFKTLEASIRQQGQEIVGIKREGNQYSFTTDPTVLTISPGPNTVIESYKDIQVGYYESGKWVPLERGYEIRQKDGNIEVVLTDPSLIALYQRLEIIGEVIYRNKDGKDRKTERIDHTFSVGVLGFELQTYNPNPITRDINGTILSDEYVAIAELKPYRNNELRPSRILVYASDPSESKILSLEQGKDFIYKDGKMSLTKKGLEKISREIGSDTVFLSVRVESVVRDRQNQRVPESSITEEGRLTLNFKTLEASIRQQGQEIVGIKREGNQYSFTTDPTVLTISPGPNTVIESYKDIQVGYYESGKWVPLERGYEIRQKDGNIEVVLTDPSLIALYQRLGIIGEVIYRNKDGKDRKTERIDHTFSVGVLGFELQTYNPNPITRDINGTILSDEYVAIAELKPYRNNELRPSRILVYASDPSESKILSLEQGKDFIYKDGKMSLTKKGLEKISREIGSDTVFLSVRVESVVRDRQNQRVPESSITEEGRLTLNFKTLEASIRQQGQEIVGIKREGNQYSFTTDPTVLTISPGPNTVIESYKDIQVGYYESGKWVPLERGYEIRQKDGNIEVVLTDPSLIALYQRLGIIGEVIYRNKDGKDRKTERIDHTFSVGVLGFELQTYNPNPITRDINGTILSDEYVAIAELKPYRNNELRPSRILVYASDPSESKILSLEQGKDFIYKDGKMSLTKKGLEKISREIGSDTVFLSVRVESVVRDRQNQRVPESSITEEGRLTLNFKTLEASIRQQGQEIVGIKREGNQYSFTTDPTVLTISPGPNTVIESYKDIQVGYYESGKWVPLERGYEIRQKDGNIEVVLTDPSLIALYQRLGIIGEVIYRNKDGKDRKTERIDHTFSVGVLGFELQTYNPNPITRDINGTILSDEYVAIAELKPYRNNELRPSRILVYASDPSESKILSLEQGKDFIYKDGKMSLTKKGLEKISREIGSDTVFLSVRVESVVRDRQNQRVPESSITEEGRLTLNFKTLEASIRQQGQEIVGIKREGNQYSFTTDPTVLTISPGPNTVIESYKDIQVGYYESGKWVPLERGYEIRQKDGNIEVVLTDPSLIALYQRLGIIGEVIYRNKDGKDRKTERIDHTFSVRVEEVKYALELKAPKYILEGAREPEVPFTVKTDAPSYETYFNGQKIEGNAIPTRPGVLTVRLPDGQEVSQEIGIEPASASMPEYIMVTTQRGDTREQQFNQIIKQLEEALRIQLSTNLTLTEEGIKIKIYDGEKVFMERVLRSNQYSIDGNVITFSKKFLEEIAAGLVLENPNLKLEVSFSGKSKNSDTFGTREFTLSSNILMLRQEAQQTRQLDIKPLEPIIPSIIPIDVIPTVKEFGQNTGGLMGDNTNNNVEKAQKAASALAKLILLQKGSDDPKKLQELQGLGTEFIDNVNGIQFHIPVLSGQSLLKDLLERVLGSPNQQNPAAYTFSLGDLITLARSNDDAKALLGAVLFKDYADSGASEDDLRGIGDAFIKLYNAISNKEFEKINDIIEEINDIINKIPQSPDISFQNSLLYALLPSSVKSTLIVKTKIAEFRINLGEIRGKINEHIDGLVRFSAFLEAGIAYIITRMPDNQQEQTSLIVLSPGIAINSVVWDNENNKYVFELNASALAEFGIGSEPRFFGYRLQFNARGKLKLIQDENITMKINPQASVSVVNGLTSLFAGVDAFVYMGPEIRVESSGISTRPIVLYGGIKGNLSSGTYDARFGAAYNTQLGSGILTLQGQYDLGKGLSLGVNYSTEDFAGQFSYYSNTNRFQVGIEVKLK